MENEKVGKFDFTVEKEQTDGSAHMALPAMVAKMLDVACRHAEVRGFGLSSLTGTDRKPGDYSRKYTWVMSRLAYEIYEMPEEGQHFSILSWVENIYHQFTNRCFEIQNEEGKVIGCARSIWAMIDMETRKSVDLHLLYGENLQYYASDRPCPIEGPARIRMTQPALAAEMPVVEEDIDFNGHVNSVRYIGHVLDVLKKKAQEEQVERPAVAVQRLDIAYMTEALMGDTLRYFVQKDSEDLYSVEIMNQEDKVICRVLLKLS